MNWKGGGKIAGLAIFCGALALQEVGIQRHKWKSFGCPGLGVHIIHVQANSSRAVRHVRNSKSIIVDSCAISDDNFLQIGGFFCSVHPLFSPGCPVAGCRLPVCFRWFSLSPVFPTSIRLANLRLARRIPHAKNTLGRRLRGGA